MATTFEWAAPETLATALTTQMDSLANSTSDTTGFGTLSSEIDNSAGLFQYIELEFHIATQGGARAAGAFVVAMISVAVDSAGPTYPDDSNAAFAEQLSFFSLDAATTARTITKNGIPIPPNKFKLYVWNKTGQAFASSGNTLKYRRYNEQGV